MFLILAIFSKILSKLRNKYTKYSKYYQKYKRIKEESCGEGTAVQNKNKKEKKYREQTKNERI
jgi:hypothetical protein